MTRQSYQKQEQLPQPYFAGDEKHSELGGIASESEGELVVPHV